MKYKDTYHIVLILLILSITYISAYFLTEKQRNKLNEELYDVYNDNNTPSIITFDEIVLPFEPLDFVFGSPIFLTIQSDGTVIYKDRILGTDEEIYKGLQAALNQEFCNNTSTLIAI